MRSLEKFNTKLMESYVHANDQWEYFLGQNFRPVLQYRYDIRLTRYYYQKLIMFGCVVSSVSMYVGCNPSPCCC